MGADRRGARGGQYQRGASVYRCSRCGQAGHTARAATCLAKQERRLWRCTLCRGLAWENERAMHLYDHHGRAARGDQLGELFAEASLPEFDDSDHDV